MVNPEHMAVVKKGAAAIEEWRFKHPEQTLDLFKANLYKARLSKTDLSEANIFQADLDGADLSETNLAKADLRLTTLINADLSGANLSEANLHEANLLGANLSNTDLTGADITLANLYGANLSKANLSNANGTLSHFYGANLTGARLFGADLSLSVLIKADLSGANLSGSNLFQADLTRAELVKSDLSGADLSFVTLYLTELLETNLSNTNLTGTKLVNVKAEINLSGARMNYTTLGDCNLTKFRGLETIKHEGPSNIDVKTIVNSFRAAGNCLTLDIKNFLLNAGLPKEILETLPSILAEVKYCTCFVCYGQPDLVFAESLVENLKARGVSCWLYSMDYTPGRKVWGEIIQKRREAEKMIVLCSAKALVRNGVLKEIEEQIDENPDKMVPISLDDLWKENGFSVKRGQRDLKTFLLDQNYADFTDEPTYDKSLSRLLKGLKRTEK